MSTSRSPGTPMASGSTVPSGWRSLTTTFFSVSAAVHVAGRSRREVGAGVHQVDERGDRRRVGRVLDARRRGSSNGTSGGGGTRTASTLAA